MFEGLGKLLSAGNTCLQQHQQFIDRLRGLQIIQSIWDDICAAHRAAV
jgi:hypothetical protein